MPWRPWLPVPAIPRGEPRVSLLQGKSLVQGCSGCQSCDHQLRGKDLLRNKQNVTIEAALLGHLRLTPPLPNARLATPTVSFSPTRFTVLGRLDHRARARARAVLLHVPNQTIPAINIPRSPNKGNLVDLELSRHKRTFPSQTRTIPFWVP